MPREAILLDLAIVVTTYNSSAVIARALGALRNRPPDDSPAEVIVVDNASGDGSAELAEKEGATLVIRNDANLGLSRANNIGARASTASSLFFINPDVFLLPGCLRRMAEFASSEREACLLGPALLDPGDESTVLSSARTFPTPLDILLRRTALGRLEIFRDRLHRHLFPVRSDAPSKVDWLSGAAVWLTPAGRTDTGLMSERYFLYFEDVEWAWRARTRGMDAWYVPDARALHAARRESARGPGTALWHHLRSMLIFYATHPRALLGLPPGRGTTAAPPR